ncbi:serine hydrolase [Paenibacillus jilunlii]|uniref:serine hydrolase n=1 Tax=Paenibacillus jilunlii TaxID=682956 RepID=UPI000943CE39|nr:serine hydrolase [Paenibacillus jilunlii]
MALQRLEPRQVHPPGKVVAYSNFGVALAGYIVELQSGEPFYTYVERHIFEVSSPQYIWPSKCISLNER